MIRTEIIKRKQENNDTKQVEEKPKDQKEQEPQDDNNREHEKKGAAYNQRMTWKWTFQDRRVATVRCFGINTFSK